MCTNNLAIFSRLGGETVWRKDGVLIPKRRLCHYDYEFNKKYGYNKLEKIVTPIPCGHCPECRAEQAQEAAFRAAKELEQQEDNVMVTLTYDDEHLPINKFVDEEGEIKEVSTLRVEDMQRFFNSLQKHYKGFRRAYCGEYGSNDKYTDRHGNERVGTNRPHYHAILFGVKPKDMEFYKWSYCEWDPKIKNKLYTSKEIQKLWKHGHVELNEANYETCKYVAGYVAKKYKDHKTNEDYEKEGRVAPFYNTSRNPGLGYQYYKDNIDKFLEDKPHYIMTRKGLKEIRPGRYFDKQLEKDFPDILEKLKQKRLEKSKQRMDEILRSTNLTKAEIDKNRESAALKRQAFQKRRL